MNSIKINSFLTVWAFCCCLVACKPASKPETVLPKTYSAAEIKKESDRANAFFDACFDAYVLRNPEYETQIGGKVNFGKWNPVGDAYWNAERAFAERELDSLHNSFVYEKLDASTKLSYLLFEEKCNHTLDDFKWRYYNYPINQMDGFQSTLPAFLMSVHGIDTLPDAEAYLSRLSMFKSVFDAQLQELYIRDSLKIIPPKFVFFMALQDCKNMITGAPFDNSKINSPLLEDFTAKVNGAKSIKATDKAQLIMTCKDHLIQQVKPAYEALINFLIEQERSATLQDGCWKWPNGSKYYAYAIKRNTTIGITPEEIFETGKKEVERIHNEMKKIMRNVNFRNDNIIDFFNYLRNDPKFYYPNTPEGKQSYVNQATAIIDTMRSKLDLLFLTKPKAAMVIKQVEPFREQSAGGAFYEQPSADGSRPGAYYLNTFNMKDQPIYQMEALAYHEGIPGHHMQVAIAQELENIPKFRKYNSNTAYDEGWALYSEWIPKEIGLYQDPYSDFGRLANEVFRAARLVVDAGIHYKKWSREQALAYFLANTPNSEGDCKKEIERYIVWPGQATGYKIGMMKIQSLRREAQDALGDKFDVRQFHDLVLKNGALPMSLLAEQIRNWIDENEKTAN